MRSERDSTIVGRFRLNALVFHSFQGSRPDVERCTCSRIVADNFSSDFKPLCGSCSMSFVADRQSKRKYKRYLKTIKRDIEQMGNNV